MGVHRPTTIWDQDTLYNNLNSI